MKEVIIAFGAIGLLVLVGIIGIGFILMILNQISHGVIDYVYGERI